MEELVGFFPWNLEADKPFARGNRLLALTASDRFAQTPMSVMRGILSEFALDL
jgi:hypothetical protein